MRPGRKKKEPGWPDVRGTDHPLQWACSPPPALRARECKDPRRTVARATYIAVGLIVLLYALSSWLLGVAAGPAVITNPEALIEAGFTTPDGKAPDPTVVFFATGEERLGEFFGDAASLLFATSLFAALLSFHNAVARYALHFSLQIWMAANNETWRHGN